jgi:hypothetical protein
MYPLGEHFRQEWMVHASLHLAFEATGIYVIVFLIEEFIRRQEAATRRRLRRVAYGSLRQSLSLTVKFLVEIGKAAMREEPDSPPIEVRDLFDDRYFKRIEKLDFTTDSPRQCKQPAKSC